MLDIKKSLLCHRCSEGVPDHACTDALYIFCWQDTATRIRRLLIQKGYEPSSVDKAMERDLSENGSVSIEGSEALLIQVRFGHPRTSIDTPRLTTLFDCYDRHSMHSRGVRYPLSPLG